ncbi:MAG: hypothetical protein U9Q58_08130 [Pseudomonadota bacterium]|nr:hypothetical protein [Pseudomonadota bacterium]
MAKIVIACSKQPLAAFIEAALNRGLVDCRIAVDADQLLTLVTELRPDALLFEAEFPTLEGRSALLGVLRTENPQIPIVGIFEPFAETQGEAESGFSPENVLQLPFGEDELSEKLQQVAGLDMKKRTALLEKEGGKEMAEPQTALIETVELTDIIEEGLPLNELPEISAGEASEVFSEVDSDQAAGVAVFESEGENADEFELEDFGDTLDDLVSSVSEPEEGGSVIAGESGAEIETETDLEAGVESEIEDNLSALVEGDTDALLADDDFTEIEISESPETHDPVLAELKSAGLTPENDVVEGAMIEAVSSPTPELNLENDADDEVLVDIIPEAAETPVASAASEEIFTAESPDAEIELPEDYLVDEELSDAGVDTAIDGEVGMGSGVDINTEPDSESAAQVLPTASSLTLESGTAEVCTEPISPDFSRQIESMTQEWSKQLLHTTYASMDKMIKAIGDLAPTIVDQVAREVIPPLAEKVIKAEIARLEEKLESEEEQENSDS